MADKMWAGRFSKELDKRVNDFNSSISFDARMYKQDIIGSIVHAKMLGDIVISKEKVLSQAEEYGHSVKRELGFLVAHSMLHLLGYDHMEPDEAKVMEAKQEEILTSLGITR